MIITKYHDLDLETSEYRIDADGTEHFLIRVENAPKGVGGQRTAQAEPVTVPRDLRKRVRRLEQRKLDKSGIISLGKDLAALLFPNEEMRRFLARSWERIPGNEGLRIRLKLATYALADLPWEYIYLPLPPTGFATHQRRISLVRYEVMEQARQCTLLPLPSFQVLILSANPVGDGYRELDLTGEIEGIASALKEEVQGVEFAHYPDATLENLNQALKRSVHVFHFAGHGRFEGDLGKAFKSQGGRAFIVLVDKDRMEHPFSANTLKVKLADRGVRLVVLNACESGRPGERDQLNEWTGIAPALIEAGIPAVLGMQYSIKDHLAKEFSKEFYRALAAGFCIDAAVAEGRQAIFTHSTDDEPEWRDWGVPVLYLHQSAGAGVIFPRKQTGSTSYEARSGEQVTRTRVPTFSPTKLAQLRHAVDRLSRHIALFEAVELVCAQFPTLTERITECQEQPDSSFTVWTVRAILPNMRILEKKARDCIETVEKSKELLSPQHRERVLSFIAELEEFAGKIEKDLENPKTEHYTAPGTSAQLDERLEYCGQLVKDLDEAIKNMEDLAEGIREKLYAGIEYWVGEVSRLVDELSKED